MYSFIRTAVTAALFIGAANAASASCKQYGKVRSEISEQRVVIDLVNTANVPVRVYWIDFDGKLQDRGMLRAGEWMGQKSYVSHPFIMLDSRNVCRGLGVVDRDTQEIVAR
jgi:hypothetical protein